MPARGVRHGKSAEQDFIVIHIHQDPALGLVLTPAGERVGFAQCGDVLRATIDDGEAIKMTAVFRGQRTDKRRTPARMKTMLRVERAKTTEAGVDDPKLVVPIPRK